MEDSLTNFNNHGNVERLSVRPVERRPVVPPPPDAPAVDLSGLFSEAQCNIVAAVTQAAQQTAHTAVTAALNQSNTTIIGTLHAIGVILAVRFILLLALVGSFALAVMAMQNPTVPAIALFVAFVALTVIPLVWLDRNGRRMNKDQ